MEPFSKIALKYSSELGRILTHLTIWTEDYKKRCPTLKYIKRNQKRITEAFLNRMYNGVDFYSIEDKDMFIGAPFYLSLVTKDSFLQKDMKYGILIMECKLDYLREHTNILKIPNQFLNDIKSIMDPINGTVTVMQRGKMPSFYFRNSMSSDLTTEEKQEVKIWEREGHRFETIVRDIYWGNVITRKHWGNDKTKEGYLLKAIKQECKENVFWIDENTLFFCAPFEICVQDDPKMLDFKDRMYKVFDKLGIEIIRAHLDRYPEPKVELPINLLQEDTSKKPKKLRSKKKLIIRYRIRKDSEETKEHKCIAEVLAQAGPLPLIIKSEKVQDGLLSEVEISGSKVSKVRQAIIYCIKKLNMEFEVNPPIDEEDSIEDVDFTLP
jgi:hypothetical protein